MMDRQVGGEEGSFRGKERMPKYQDKQTVGSGQKKETGEKKEKKKRKLYLSQASERQVGPAKAHGGS